MTSSEYRLPALPLGSAAATLLRWLKRPGDPLAAGEPLLIVVSGRAEVALPAASSGTLGTQLCAEGDTVAVGTALATLIPAIAADAGASVETVSAPKMAPAAPAAHCTPVARQIAAAHDLDLRGISGHGVSGRVTKADVLAVLAQQPPIVDVPAAHVPPIGEPADQLGTVIAAPADTQVLTAIEVDLGPVLEQCRRLREAFARRGLEITPATFVLEAVVAALLRYPLLNSRWDENYIVVWRPIELELCGGGRRLRVLGAQDLNLRGLARALRDAPASAPLDSTFTVIEYDQAVWCGMPMLAPGHGAALGIGAPRARPTVVSEDGAERVGIGTATLLALAYDARVIDQPYADAFLRDVRARLEQRGSGGGKAIPR
jgi:2-oxoglutarate dehydrogenase E2 component (dihydrolipoamide succinyltransferase)